MFGRVAACLSLAALLITSAASAATVSSQPVQDKICKPYVGKRPDYQHKQVVDRQAFADSTIATYSISEDAYAPVTKDVTADQKSIYIVGRIDTILEDCSNKTLKTYNAKCAKSDIDNAQGIIGYMAHFMLPASQTGTFTMPGGKYGEPFQSYMLDTDSQRDEIVCLLATGTAPAGPVASGDMNATSATGGNAGGPWYSNFRVRGTTDDLYLDRDNLDGTPNKNFNSASQTTLSYASDAVTGKTTGTIQGVVGYAFKFPDRLSALIPYLGINHQTVKVTPTSAAKASATDTYDIGLVGAVYDQGQGEHALITVFNVRPDYLMDRIGKSKLATLSLQIVPIRTGGLNDYNLKLTPFAIKGIVDFRLDSGSYLDRGVPSVAPANKDYLRAGSQVGLAAVTTGTNVPQVSLSSTYTALAAIRGKIKIGYFSNAATYYPNSNKYIGLTLTYTNGRREDTAKREQQVSISLTSKF